VAENDQPTPPLTAVDFQSVFQAMPACYLLLSPDLTALAATTAYYAATNTTPETLLGRYLFDVFPETPQTVRDTKGKNLSYSLQEVLRTKKPHTMPLQRYDLKDTSAPGEAFITRWWRIVNTPIFDAAGTIRYIIETAEDVTTMMEALETAEDALSDSRAA
jgi:PAS domain-containing protein